MNFSKLRASDLLVYQFSRRAVEAGDFQDFLDAFGLDRLPRGRDLRRLYNRLVIVVDGYDYDARELYEIPEVREFYTAFARAWPYWLFFSNLDQPGLLTMTLCCLPSVLVVRSDKKPGLQVQFNHPHLAEFMRHQFDGMNFLFDRAGMGEAENRRRTREISEYYQGLRGQGFGGAASS